MTDGLKIMTTKIDRKYNIVVWMIDFSHTGLAIVCSTRIDSGLIELIDCFGTDGAKSRRIGELFCLYSSSVSSPNQNLVLSSAPKPTQP
jgi:hypothetical protein